jgi:sirohydrochlorin cobaltochelatase
VTTTAPAVVLVGHGAPPRDAPAELVARLKMLEGRRRAAGSEASAEEREIDARLRSWPRNDDNDPYRAGFERLASALRTELLGRTLVVAYNEFCAPSLEDAVGALVEGGVRDVTVVPSMLTPGGVHSEVEIPEALAALRSRYPDLALRYAWPFNLGAVARLLAAHVAG